MRTDVVLNIGISQESTLPSWVPPVGQFARIPATNTLLDVLPSVYKDPITGDPIQGGDPALAFASWSSGFFADEAGAMGKCVFIGEDHANYSYISTNVFDIATLSWSIKNVPSRAYTRVVSRPDWLVHPFDEFGFYNYDPDYMFNPGHTYDGVSYFPKSWGSTGDDGHLFLHRGSVSPTPDVMKLRDFSKEVVPDIKMWDSALRSLGVDTEVYPGTNLVPTYPNCAMDNQRKGWYCSKYVGGQGWLIFVPSNGSPPVKVTDNGTGWQQESMWKWEDKDVLLGFHGFKTAADEPDAKSYYRNMRVQDCQTGKVFMPPLEAPPETLARLDLPENGGKSTTNAYGLHSLGFKYSQTLNAFVGYRGRKSRDVFILNLPGGDPTTGTYTLSHITFTSADGSEPNLCTQNETFGRFMEIPALRSFFWADSSRVAPQLFRIG